MFEVADTFDMRSLQAPCQLAAERYLGTHYDPNSKFTVTALWPGKAAETQPDGRQLLCGLQLLGPDSQPVPFKGRVAQLDQSKIWPTGTCLGIDSASNQPTNIPVDCAAPHAVEVTGAVNLSERFSGPPPAQREQDDFIKDACTRVANAYLSPIPLNATVLKLNYSSVSPASWLAGSHQVSCGIGATLNNDQGWATLTGTAKGGQLISGNAPAAPPATPEPQQNTPDQGLGTPNTAVNSPRPVFTQPSATAPTPVSSPTPTATASPSPTATPSPSETATPSPSETATPTSEAPQAGQVIEIPGLAPVTLPAVPGPSPPPPSP
jgi:hypothetical protein